MPTYFIQTIDSNGLQKNHDIVADSEAEALETIKQEKLYILKIEMRSQKEPEKVGALFRNIKKSSFFHVRSPSNKDIFTFTFKFAALLDAGLPLLRSLSILKKHKQLPSMKKILSEIEKDISSGDPLSLSMSRYPSIFKPLYVSMIRAGEAGGVLLVVLERLAEFYERSYLFRKRVTYAMFYPFLIFATTIFIFFILLLFVIPKFQVLFQDLKVSLPYATKALLMVSQFTREYFFCISLFSFVLISFVSFSFRFKRYKGLWEKISIKLPFWGSLIQSVEVVQFSRLLGTLLQSGVPILQAFEIAKSATTHTLFKKAIQKTYDQVKEGNTISIPLKETKVFPEEMVDMVEVGEESGQFDTMLLKVAFLYEEEVKRKIEAITKMIEPLLIFFLALLVGFIVISMFLPLVSMMNALGR
ncbi:hypothetical protein AB834_05795 [PVC group bacterium (ex Bugula neritina AB1)]|nr:hypothetical protein AB834_05795 [PVC group bacterium (ex Bugula neritina AB1)]